MIGSCGDDGGPVGPCLLVNLRSVTAAPPSKVTAFFTVDRCTGEPVVGLTAANIEIREDGARIPASESQQRLVRQPEVFRVHTIVVLDLTRSIIAGDQLTALLDAARGMVAGIIAQGPEHYVAVYAFDGAEEMRQIQAFTNDGAALEAAITAIATRQCTTSTECAAPRSTCAVGSGTGLCVDESTNLYGAVVDGIAAVDASLMALTTVPFKIGNVVLITDSADQAQRETRATAVSRANATASAIFAVSLGVDADQDFLSVVAQDGTAHAATTAELTAATGQIGETIRQNTGRHYLLEYCSPKRAGTHTLGLVVTAGEDNATGDASRTFSAAGFTSGCSL
jgi:hypothetical protein